MADELNDGTGATAATDAGGTNPQAGPSSQQTDPSQQLDTKGATDNPTEGYHVSTGAIPFPGDQNGPQQAAQAPQPSSGLPNGPATGSAASTPPAVTAAIQKADYTHKILQALAGGPQIATTINPETGVVERKQVPVSTARLGMSVALAALTGAFNGLAEKGPGAEGRAAAGGFDAALQQKQNEQKQQELEASQTYARQAAIASTNFTIHQTVQRMAKLDYDFQKQQVADQAPALQSVKAVGGDLASGVRGSDLMPKYNITKDSAILDGVVESIGEDGKQLQDKYGQPLWEPTYTVVDPQKKIALPQETAQLLADHHVPGYFTQDANGKIVPKEFSGSAQVKAGLVINGLAQASAISTTEGQLKQQVSRLPNSGEDVVADIKKALDNRTVDAKSLQAFAPYASMPFDQALDAMRKNKVDPTAIGQISSLLPQGVQDALKSQRLETETKENATREAEAAHIKAQSALPDEVKKEQAVGKVRAQNAFAQSYNSEHGTLAAKAKYGEGTGPVNHEMVNNPKLNAVLSDQSNSTAPIVKGQRQGALDKIAAVDPSLAALVQAVGEGRQFQSKYGLAKGDGQRLAALVQTVYPQYNQAKADAYDKLVQTYTGGADKDQLERGRTALLHIANLYDNAGEAGAGLWGTDAHTRLQKDIPTLAEEINGAYTKGVLHADQRNQYESGLNSTLTYQRLQSAQETMKLLADKIHEKQTSWKNGKVTDAAVDFPLLDQDSVDAYNHVMGSAQVTKATPYGPTKIDKFGNVYAAQPPKAAVSTGMDKSGRAWYLDSNNKPVAPAPLPDTQ